MHKSFACGLATLAVCIGGVNLLGADGPVPARVFRHTAANGQVYCAVILKADGLPKDGVARPPKDSVARQHLILIDTSASQVGEHRQQSLAVLQSLLKALPETDRVRLFAVDLRAEPMDEGFNDVNSPAVASAVERLKLRVPLGATNLEAVLRTAMQSATDLPADITYIGDGMSTADLLEVAELRSLVSDLRQRQIPVHGFGVGSQRNMQMLGVLALQTGGFVTQDPQVLDVDEEVKAKKTKSGKLAKDIARVNRGAAERAVEQGKTLAAALKAPIFFPAELRITPQETSMLPADALPVRNDRETIYLVHGNVSDDARLVMVDSVGGTSLEWKLEPVDQPGATFLPVMIGQLEQTRGLTNPLAGMTLFHLAQSDFSDNITAMAQRAGQALQMGDIVQARKISQIVTEADPNNEAGRILRKSIDQLKPNSTNRQGQKALPANSKSDVKPGADASPKKDPN
jgi:hypothetical protein